MTTTTSRANKTPTDLGVLGLDAVKRVLEETKGKSVVYKPEDLVQDDFSHLTYEESTAIAAAARERVLSYYTIPKATVLYFFHLYLFRKLVDSIIFNAFPKVKGIRTFRFLLSNLITIVMFITKMKADPPLNPRPLGSPEESWFWGTKNMKMEEIASRTHNFVLELMRQVNFQSLELLVPLSAFCFLMDARDREHVLKTNSFNYLKTLKEIYHLLNLISLKFLVDKSEWLFSRKTASHMFSGNALKSRMESVFNHHADRLVQSIKEKVSKHGSLECVDMQDVFQSVVFDGFCEIAFDYFPDATSSAIEGKKPQFLLSFDICQTIVAKRFLQPPQLWTLKRLFNIGDEGQLKIHLKIVEDTILPLIKLRLAEKDISHRNDLLSLYIQNARQNNETLSENELRDIIMNFMIAGRDTTSCTLTYMIKFLSENREVESRLLNEEATKLLSLESINWDDSRSVPFADAIFNEVLRLAPPVGDDLRLTAQDETLPSGFRVRKGYRVLIPNVAIGRDPFLWSNPEEFIPERWMKYDFSGNPEPVKRVDEYVHPVFFAGRRLCLGKDMARFETIIFMIKLLRNFKFTCLDDTFELGSAPVIFLKDGLKCRVEFRE